MRSSCTERNVEGADRDVSILCEGLPREIELQFLGARQQATKGENCCQER